MGEWVDTRAHTPTNINHIKTGMTELIGGAGLAGKLGNWLKNW